MAVGSFGERLALILELDPSSAIAGMRKVGDAAEKELGKVDNRLNAVGGRMQMVGAGAVAFAGIAARGLFSLAEASEEANRSTLALNNTYANAPQLAGESSAAITDLAESIQSKTAADADDIAMGASVLGQYGAEQEAILQLTPLIVDLARKKGIDMVAANTAIGKALNGNIGALARMGIQVDETAFAEDRLAAVTDALAGTVGGFSEAEGATFAGQIERLKNQLGDLAEGVGSGVVDAFSGFVNITGSVTERLGSLDAGTQRGIGKFAAYLTAAVGAAGGLTFLSGSALKLIDRLAPLQNAADGGGRSLTTMGKIAGGLTFAATIAGLIAMGNEMSKLQVDVEGLATATDDQVDSFVAMLPTLERYGFTAESVADQLLSQNVPAAERWADALDRNGQSSDAVRGKIEAKREQDVQGAIDQENYTSAVGAAADATGELEAATEDLIPQSEALADITKGVADAANQAADALSRLHGETLTGLEANSAYQGAVDDLTDSIAENGASLDANTAEGRANIDAAVAAAGAVTDLIGVRVEETGSLEEARAAGELYVANLRQQLSDAGLTEDQVNSYIDTLNLTPEDITTLIQQAGGEVAAAFVATYQEQLNALDAPKRTLIQALIDRGAYDEAERLLDMLDNPRQVRINPVYGTDTAPQPSKGQYASGVDMGPIPGSPGQVVPIDAHAGELVVNAAQQKNLAANLAGVRGGGDGGGGGVTIVIQTLNVATTLDATNVYPVLIDALQTGVRQNGKGDIQRIVGVA